jgi:ATP-binding cassette subfamily B (MDR/TAP) protein 1
MFFSVTDFSVFFSQTKFNCFSKIKSGCGKSTIIALLQRFYLPRSGQILLDDTNIDELQLSWLRNQMALVSQEPALFTRSIK